MVSSIVLLLLLLISGCLNLIRGQKSESLKHKCEKLEKLLEQAGTLVTLIRLQQAVEYLKNNPSNRLIFRGENAIGPINLLHYQLCFYCRPTLANRNSWSMEVVTMLGSKGDRDRVYQLLDDKASKNAGIKPWHEQLIADYGQEMMAELAQCLDPNLIVKYQVKDQLNFQARELVKEYLAYAYSCIRLWLAVGIELPFPLETYLLGSKFSFHADGRLRISSAILGDIELSGQEELTELQLKAISLDFPECDQGIRLRLLLNLLDLVDSEDPAQLYAQLLNAEDLPTYSELLQRSGIETPPALVLDPSEV